MTDINAEKYGWIAAFPLVIPGFTLFGAGIGLARDAPGPRTTFGLGAGLAPRGAWWSRCAGAPDRRRGQPVNRAGWSLHAGFRAAIAATALPRRIRMGGRSARRGASSPAPAWHSGGGRLVSIGESGLADFDKAVG